MGHTNLLILMCSLRIYKRACLDNPGSVGSQHIQICRFYMHSIEYLSPSYIQGGIELVSLLVVFGG